MCIWQDTAPRRVAPKAQKRWRPKLGRLFCRLCRQKHRFFATNYCCLLRSGGERGQIGLVYLAGYRSPPGCAKSAKMLAAQARPPLLPTLSPKAPLFCLGRLFYIHNVNAQMLPDSQALKEVVVTALGIKREKKMLGYSVQDVKADALNRRMVTIIW